MSKIFVAILLVISLISSNEAIECHDCVYYGRYENPGDGLELCQNADYVRSCKGDICFIAYGMDSKIFS